MICHNCKGNGYVKLNWEANESVEQCKVCDSQGELDESKHYHQTLDRDWETYPFPLQL